MTTTARAHPNIALIKYWGKQPGPGNVPATPSLSITLDELTSTTEVDEADRDEVILDGEPVNDRKILGFLQTLRARYDIPRLRIDTRNNFPTAAGLASSASGFAALVTAINAHCRLGMSDAERSDFARQASGSAARSIHGGFVGLSAPQWIAEPVLDSIDWPLKVVIAITDEGRKSVSSTDGMRASEATSAFYPAWVSSTTEDYRTGLSLVAERDFPGLADLAEASCLKMHALMLSTRPPMIYWRPATLACIETVRELRKDGCSVFFTIDAGPQLKAICLPDAATRVAAALDAVPGVLSTRVVGLGGGAEILGP